MIRTQQQTLPPASYSLPPAVGITVHVLLGIDATTADDPFGVYALIGDAGPVTAPQLAARLQLHVGYVQPWLKWQASVGYLHRDEFGRYATSCPWPRAAL